MYSQREWIEKKMRSFLNDYMFLNEYYIVQVLFFAFFLNLAFFSLVCTARQNELKLLSKSFFIRGEAILTMC